MRKNLLPASLTLLAIISLASCDKQSGAITSSSFYGKWKASYNDTIEFTRTGGKNIIRYNQSMNPSFTVPADYEYTYQNNKLGIKDGLSGLATFRFYQSFRWIEEGRSFEIQGVEWFPFISSTLTYFTFTRIP
ncbi:MAG: hypothetical protein JNK14_09855 [Chitinophagaceae bacterium]|nr:hypothetical protein [Chitinophagaceae bacterium]